MAALDLSFEAIGTKWQITSEIACSDEKCSNIAHAIQTRIEQFDKNYSRFRQDSLVTKMSQIGGAYDLPADGYTLLQFYKHLYVITGGKVTPLIGQVIADLGYDANYSFEVGEAKQPLAWDSALKYSDKQITLLQPALLDFGAAGKGYLIDLIGQLLNSAAIRDYMINAGGDILYKNANDAPISVGLENPFDQTEIVGVVEIANRSICASAGSRRRWDKYTHIIDPDELKSPTDVQATWVIADTAMLADGLATALHLVKPAALKAGFTFSYAILRADMSLEYSRDFPLVLDKVSA